MARDQAVRLGRRRLLQGGLSVAGLLLAGCGGAGRSAPDVVEPPPETTTLKLDQRSSICRAPQYLAKELLRHEGFTDIQYIRVKSASEGEVALAAGEVNINLNFAAPNILRLDAGDLIVVLAGAHVGCFELFGADRVRAIHDLKGKTVAVSGPGSAQHVFLSSMIAYVGLDPARDVNWVTHPFAESTRLLAEERIDAFLGFPPEPQELRAKKIGRVVVNSMLDRPWSQYFCCVIAGNREFVRTNPVATKRAVRAILKANDICAAQPDVAARALVDQGFTDSYDYALQAMQDIPYNKWREYDPEDTLRFYSLRLHEAGMIKASPEQIISRGTDWRFLNELKQELKA